MKEPKFYVEISVEKELPKEGGFMFVNKNGVINGPIKVEWYEPESFKQYTHYLKPFSLPELMGDLLFKKYTDEFQVPFERLEQVRKECIEEATQYLTQKGILWAQRKK